MREVIETVKLYTFSEANPELRDKIRDYFHLNSMSYEHCMEERIETLKKFAEFTNAELDYSISCVPDRGEYIQLKSLYSYSDEQYEIELTEKINVFLKLKESCPLTGVCYDEDLRDSLTKHGASTEGLEYALQDYLNSIHEEYEYMLSDEYLLEMCETNEYEFTENGHLY